jgi:hypothetical protein
MILMTLLQTLTNLMMAMLLLKFWTGKVHHWHQCQLEKEGRVSTLQNDINKHRREAKEEFEQLVGTKLKEYKARREEKDRQRLEEEQRGL